MKNILLALQLDDDEDLLLIKAQELARAFGAKVWLLHIAAPDPDFVGYEVGPQYIRDSRADELKQEHRLLQEYAEALTQQGIAAEGLLIQGTTEEMILTETDKLGIDLIIMGHHDHGLMYKLFVGSVSTQIINKSDIPVMIVPL